jgi:hypothetical protein
MRDAFISRLGERNIGIVLAGISSLPEGSSNIGRLEILPRIMTARPPYLDEQPLSSFFHP